jgi:hypothetical protein
MCNGCGLKFRISCPCGSRFKRFMQSAVSKEPGIFSLGALRGMQAGVQGWRVRRDSGPFLLLCRIAQRGQIFGTGNLYCRSMKKDANRGG